jgi:8-oxo-dGTP pyrophosphatase MutT (NUDIX family)
MLQSSSQVFVEGKRVEFGQCVYSLLNWHNSEETSSSAVYVKTTSHIEEQCFVLNLQKCKKEDEGSHPFEHFHSCPAQKMYSLNHSKSIHVGVSCVVEWDGHILLTLRHSQLRSFPNLWVLPGGHIESGENLIQAGLREVHEETGIQLFEVNANASILGFWESTFPHRYELGPITHHHVVCYLHTVVRTENIPILSLQTQEVSSILWLNRSQAAQIIKEFYDEGILSNSSTNTILSSFPVLPNDVKNNSQNDNWNTHRGKMNEVSVPISVKDLCENMSAGTHFALKKWLDQIPITTSNI